MSSYENTDTLIDFGIPLLDKYVQEGKFALGTIDRSVRRILRIKYLLGLFENPYVDVDRAVMESNPRVGRELHFGHPMEELFRQEMERTLFKQLQFSKYSEITN